MSPTADQIVDALASQLDARVVQGLWIFGSRASDGARPESDLDLGVLCTPELGVERFAIEDRVARALNLEVDLIDMASCDPILAWEIITTGRLLHEPDERAVEHFMREARFRAEDADQRNRMILLATGARR